MEVDPCGKATPITIRSTKGQRIPGWDKGVLSQSSFPQRRLRIAKGKGLDALQLWRVTAGFSFQNLNPFGLQSFNRWRKTGNFLVKL
ncbi:hypothetical protein ACLOJK_009937 [Asimina triloba]